MHLETKCLHAGYTPSNGQPRVVPIVQSTTYTYESTEEIGRLFDLTSDGYMYSRLGNPTVAAVEQKIAALEGGVGALCTSSGQAATLISLLNIMQAGDHFVTSSTIYGGTFNLFSVTLKKMGIDCTFVDISADEAIIEAAFRPNTKAFFAETIANPALKVLDIEKMATIAHRQGVPLLVDSTFATPALCRPFDYGADIVIHSTTKYLDGHAVQVGGVIVEKGGFDWGNGKFPGLTEADASYHGVRYTTDFPDSPYSVKARVQLMRDFGAYPAAHTAFLLNLGLETLPLRMAKHSENALKVARYLASSSKIEQVIYPGLEGDTEHQLAIKYLPKGASGVVSIVVKGGRQAAAKWMDCLMLISRQVHVADIRSCALHPASSTHRQLTEEQLIKAGVSPGLIRLSIGLENVEDIIEDLRQALVQL